MKKRTLSPHNLLSERQTVVNENAVVFAKQFKQLFNMKKALASLTLTMLSLLFVGVVNAQTIVLSTTNVAGLTTTAPLASGATNQVVFGFALTATVSSGNLTAVTFTTSATTVGSLSNFRLYNNGTTATYNAGTANLVATVATPGASSIAFTGLNTNNSFIVGATYFYLVCDVAAYPTGGAVRLNINAAGSITTTGNTATATVATPGFPLYSTPSSNTIASTQIITYATLNQTIGLFPNAQGGLENMTNERSRAATPVDIVPLYLATTGANFWNNRNSSTFPKINSGGNTGNKYITFPSTGTTKYMLSPCANSFAPSTTYVVQYFYRSSYAYAFMNAAIGTTSGSIAFSSSTLSMVNTGTTWTKGFVTVTTGSTATDGSGVLGFRSGGTAPTATFDFDDICAYPGTVLDATVPNDVTGFTATPGNANNVLNWTASTDQATNTSGFAGYIIVRGTAALTGAPNANGIYAVGNTLGNGTVVGLVPTGTTTFTDNAVTNGTQYFYAIYAVDNAFNYSATSATQSATPTNALTNYFWNGSNTSGTANGGSGTWDFSTTNWNTGSASGTPTAWVNNGVVNFAGTSGTVTIPANVAPNSTSFGTSGYTLTTGASAITLSNAVSLGTNAVTLAPAAAQSLTLSGIISGSGLVTIGGSGTTIFGNNANTNTGGVTVNSGTLNIPIAAALGTTAGTFTLNGGAIDNTSGGSLTLSNYPGSWGGNFTFTGTNSLNLGTGAIALTANSTVTTSASTLTVPGVISGAFRLTTAGAGTLALTGANSFTGGLTVSAGTTTLTGANTFTGDVIVSGGTLQLNRTGGTTIAATNNCTVSGGTLRVSTSQSIANLTISSGTLLIDAGVTLTVTGTYSGTGGTITNNGTINLNNSAISFPGSATTTTFNSLQISANAALNANLTLGSTGVLTLTSGVLTTTGYTLTISNTANTGVIGGSATAYISGSVSWNLLNSLTAGNANSKYTFPVGTSSAYLPMIAQFGTNGTLGNTARVQAFTAGAPYSTTNDGTLTPSSTEYWNLTTTQSGGATFNGAMPIAVTLGKASLGTNSRIGVNTGIAGAYVSYGGATGPTIGTITAVGVSDAIGSGGPGNYNIVLGDVSGATYYWNGGNASPQSADWNTGLWYTSAVATSGGVSWPISGSSIANFSNSQGGTVTLPATYNSTVASVAVTANNYTFSTAANTPSTLSSTLDIASNTLTLIPNAASAPLTLSGIVSGIGGSLVQNSGGTTILSNANNSFTGGVTINAGTLQLGSTGALNPTVPNAVSFGSGSTGKLTLNNSVTVSGLNTNATVGTPVIENGTGSNILTIASSGSNTFAGIIQNTAGTLGIASTGTGSVTLAGNNTASGTLSTPNSVSGSGGTVTLSGSNTFSSVSVGHNTTLNINNAAALGSGTVTLNSSGSNFPTIDNTSASSVTLSTNNNFSVGSLVTFTGTKPLNLGTGNYSLVSGHTLTVNGSGSNGVLTIGGVISETSAGKALTKAGTGTLILGGQNTNTGIYTVSAGTLKLGASSTVTPSGPLGVATSATVSAGAVLDLNGYNLVAPAPTTLNINGLGSLINSSTSPSTYTGTVNLQGASSIVSNAGSGDINLTGTTAISGIGSTNVLTLDGTGTNSTITGIIGGASSGTLTKKGTGAWTLSGANIYTGVTAVSQGTLIVGANAPSGSSGALGNTATAVTVGDASTPVSSTASLLIGGAFTVARALTIAPSNISATYVIGGSTDNAAIFSGNIALSNFGVSINQVATTGSNALTISGVISGSHSINKTGAGKVILTGANTFTAPTALNITAGTLVLNRTGGSTIVTTPNCAVATAGTLQVSTNQTIATLTLSGNGSLIIDAGATLTVTGAFTIGTGTITGGGSLILQGGATGFPGSTSSTFNNLQISNTAITLNNNVSVTGTLTLGANLTLAANNLTLAQANAISGSGNIVTNSTGDVIVAFPSGATVYTLPLSPNGTSLEPVTLTKTGTGTQTYTVSVGTIAFAQSNALSYSWTISTNNGASSVATSIALSWSTADANGTLSSAPGNGGVLQYISSTWDYTSGGTITGTPNTTTLTGVTDFSNSSFTVGTPPLQGEPTNYPTSFTASATSSNQGQVTLTWVDATGAQIPSGYLIKASSVGFGSITSPTDGIAISTTGLNYNTGYAVQAITITGLAENSTYYFKIFPYTNSGVDIDYKASGSAPQVSASTTNTTNVITDVFRSRTTGNWATASTWESFDGSTWITASAAPDPTSTGGITIQSGHTVTVGATIAGTGIKKLTISSGGQVTVGAGVTLTVGRTNLATADITVAGTLRNQGTVSLINGGLMTVTGTYQHDVNGGIVPTATWSTGSTCLITGITTSTTTNGFSQNFYNFTFNCTGNTGSFNLGMSRNTIGGNLTINSLGTAGGKTVALTNAAATIGANTITINGNLIINTEATNVFSAHRSGSASTTTNVTVRILGDLTLTQGILDLQNATGVANNIWNLEGNFAFNGGTFRGNSAGGTLRFSKGSGTQTFTKSGSSAFTGTNATVVVDNGSTLDMGTNVIATINATLSAGSTLITANTGGVNGSFTGTKNLASSVNYIFNGTSAQVTGAAVTGANNLTISNSAGVTISSALAVTGKVSITSGTLACGAGLLTLKSTSIANTAIVDQLCPTCKITGTAVVERFIPAGFRAYRDMAPEVYNASATTGSIFKNWQNNGSFAAGNGIFITGPDATLADVGSNYATQPTPKSSGNGLGLDYSINGNASAFTFDNATGSFNWNYNRTGSNTFSTGAIAYGIADTKAENLDAFRGYRVLIRGDRSFNLAKTPIVNYYNVGLRMFNNAKLSATGNLIYGDVTYNTSGVTASVNGAASTTLSTDAKLNSTTSSSFSMIANPYVCPVLWGTGANATQNPGGVPNTNTVYGNSTGINASYWYLDPSLGGAGFYRAYNALTGSSTSAYTNSNGSTSTGAAAFQYIQPGQAVFVQNSSSTTPVVKFTEACKDANSTKTSVFGVSKPLSKIYVSLLKEDSATVYARKDGAAIAFAAGFTNTTYGPQDALKFGAGNDNLSITDKGMSLSIDGRLPATASDVLPIALNKMTGKNYQLVIDATTYETNGFIPVLKDNYKGTVKELALDVNTIDFAVDNAIVASYANRFSLGFKVTTLAVNSIVASATFNTKIATISWKTVGEKAVSRFEVEKSTDAKSFTKIGQLSAKNTATATYTSTDNSVTATTYYRVKAISEVGTVSYSNVAQLSVNSKQFAVYPNPLVGKTLNVTFGTIAAGKYTVTINNVLGQRVQEVAISHAGGNGSHAITVNSSIAKGTYSVTIRETASGTIVHQSNLSVN